MNVCRWCSDGDGELCSACIDAFRDDFDALSRRLFPVAMFVVRPTACFGAGR